MDPQRVALAVRRARRVRVPRRHRDRARREGRRPQPDATSGVHERAPVWSPDGTRSPTSPTSRASTSSIVEAQDGKGEPKRLSDRGSRLLREPDLVARQPEDRVHRQLAVDLLCRSADGSIEEDRVAARPIRRRHNVRSAWSPGLEMARLHHRHASAGDGRVGLLGRPGQVVRGDRRFGRSHRAGVRPQRQVSVLLRLDRRRPDPELVLAVEHRHAGDAQRLHGGAAEGPASPLAKESDEEGAKNSKDANDTKEPKDKEQGQARDRRRRRTAAARQPSTPQTPIDAVPDRLRRHPVPHPRPADSGRRTSRTCKPATPGRSISSARVDDKTTLQRFDLEKRKAETAACRTSPTTTSRQTARRSSTSRTDSWSIGADDEGAEAGRGQARDRRDRGARSIRAPSGRRSSTKPGASTATTSTTRACTASTGRPRARSTRCSCPTGHAERPQPRHAVDGERAVRRPSPPDRGGRRPAADHDVPGGLLGADYSVENGRYRFTKVYGGLNWNPQLRSPLTEPGVNVKAGEYLLAVERPRPARRRRISTASSRTPRARSSRSPSARTPTAAARARCRSCRSRASRRCAIATGSKATCARSTRPPTAASRTSTCRTPPTPGHAYFKRYFFPQAHKDAVIVDERFNGGGRSPTTTSTSCGGRSSATGRCATAPT